MVFFLQEIKSSSSGTNSNTWREEDRPLLGPCAGLVKTARCCVKKVLAAMKTNGSFTTEQHVNDLDNVTYISCEVCPAIDNFICSVYPAIVRDELKVAVSSIQLKGKGHSL